ATAFCRLRWRWQRRMRPRASQPLRQARANRRRCQHCNFPWPSMALVSLLSWSMPPQRLQVAGAALAVGPAPSTGQDQAAKSFFEDLLRRGRLKVAKAKSAAEVVRAAAPSTHESYTHELRREGRQMVLRRVRIDCGFDHR